MCRKKRYRDALAAKIALASTRAAGRNGRGECRYYRCPSCKGFHLTSAPKR